MVIRPGQVLLYLSHSSLTSHNWGRNGKVLEEKEEINSFSQIRIRPHNQYSVPVLGHQGQW